MKLIPLSSYLDNYAPFNDFYDMFDELFPTSYSSNWLSNRPRSKPASNKFRINLCIGHYTPEQIKVEVEGKQLKVHGKHVATSKNGSDQSEFTRNFDLPDNVLIETLTHRVTNDGVLVIEADKKQPEVRHFFNDQSDETQLNMTFDVKGYEDKDVDVCVNGQDLIVSASHHSKTDEHGVSSEKKQHFRRIIKLGKDVDLASLTPTFTSDGYLKITGKKEPHKALEGAKKLQIKRE